MIYDEDILISSRIRLARNIVGYNFMPTLNREQKIEFKNHFANELQKNTLFNNFVHFDFDYLNELERMVLKERKIINQRYYQKNNGLVLFEEDLNVSLVLGDLDHMRISSTLWGLNINSAYQRALSLERCLASIYPFEFSNDLGFLTVNVSDSGTAMKGSLLVHLPLLCRSPQMDQFVIQTLESNLEVNGYSGGGINSLGGRYLISNKNGFFPNELQLIDLLNKQARIFIEQERDERDLLLQGNYPQIEDEIFRSLGILKYCKQITENEAIDALSMVRLGLSIGWIEDFTIEELNKISTMIGNGYLRTFASGNNPDETDIMRLRANIIKKNLNFTS